MSQKNNFKKILKLTKDPVISSYSGEDICRFEAVEHDVDIDSLSSTELRDAKYHVFETGKHALASHEYLEEGSIALIDGDEAVVQGVDRNGNLYDKKCVRAYSVEFKSYPKKLQQKINMQMFLHFAAL